MNRDLMEWWEEHISALDPPPSEAAVRIMQWAYPLKRKTLTGKQIDVLGAMLQLNGGRADQLKLEACGGVQKIAETARCSRSSVWDALKALVSAGIDQAVKAVAAR